MKVRDNLLAYQLAEFVVETIEGGTMQSHLTKDEGPMARCLEAMRATLQLRT